MVNPVKGSGIGQVSITDILTSNPKILQGLDAGLNTSLSPQGGAGGGIGLSQVPSSGLPDVMPNEGSIFDADDPSAFTIQTNRGPETISEFAKSNLSGLFSVFAPTPEDKVRQARAKGQVIPGVSEEIEAMAIRDASDARAAEDAAGQLAAGQETSRILAEAAKGKIFGESGSDQKGSEQERILADQKRMQQGQAPTVKGADTPAKQAAVSALDEYLKTARPGVAPKDYAEYIKEFGEATGLDVSGEPDNKTALMAFGLALMQNKAGKGFDVGNILSSVGEAGEKAMPALEKARANAKAIRAKAGEYALGRKKEDQAAAMNREQFYVIPKGKIGGPLGVVDAITKGKGQFVDLNSYEINNLNNNEEFNSQYEIVRASDYTDLAKEALKTPESKKIYQKGSQGIPLFSGASADLELLVQLPDRNVSTTAKPVLLSDPKQALQQIARMEKGLARGEELFTTIGGLLNQTSTSVPAQARSAIVQTLRNFGLDAGGETDPVKQIKVMLTKLKAQNAAEILGESGKTLSDNDRRMVSEIVGDISFTEGDEALLIEKLGMLYKDIIGTRRNEIEEAYSTLGNYANIKRGNSASSGLGFIKGDDGIYRRQKPPTNQ